MKIDKVYNNNVVLAKGDDGEEIIVMGRGLGFQKKPGDEIDTALVEKTFVMQDKDTTNELTRVYLDLSPAETEVVLDIIKHGQEVLGTTFDTAFYIALADHLHYTLQRTRENITIQNPLSWEIRKFFPKEYQLGRDALKIIFEKLGVILPDDEISSIALHFINAQKDSGMVEQNYQISKIVTDILGIVRLFYGKVVDEDSVSYNRFITHIQYFAQRVVNGVVQGKNDSFLYEQVKLNYPIAFSCSEKIKNYIESSYDFPMSRDEQVYITIHIQRLETSHN
ncbi:BglG family transcription antiterminator LicT [Streptococcus gallolyticus]|uniref:BglG family transcription antiterminator LicT n=1 Tax=Streptococcus gallolyticus TaxID=315405 RepID=UPI00209840CD|nr:PRD domain-containing protein [Streptococcus gallolyticus]MCO7177910.1 PRD domain-containing protein [Streptococcus gallolyticus]MCY7165572.1 PRD domain-containing protein [Streptococcus gallolyticus subsp. gallolyticus]MCY7182670.1 PRD domain-containing protein [Streptococcus gallolyticus subsp. gallolyticus]